MSGEHGGTNLPDCSASFRISDVTVGSGGPSAGTVAAGAGLAAAGLAGLAFAFKRRQAGSDSEMHAVRDIHLPDGRLPRPRSGKRGGAAAGGRAKRTVPVEEDDDDDEEAPIKPPARGKAKGAGSRAAAAGGKGAGASGGKKLGKGGGRR